MTSALRKMIFLAFALCFAGLQANAQPKSEVFNPPSWIHGEWSNLGGSEPNKIERIVFSEHEIELVQDLADSPTKFTRKFKKYQVTETPGGDTYRLVLSNSKEELIYEFTLCSREKCNLATGEALSYFVMKNKKKLWDHSNSFNKVLIKRTGGASLRRPSPNAGR